MAQAQPQGGISHGHIARTAMTELERQPWDQTQLLHVHQPDQHLM